MPTSTERRVEALRAVLAAHDLNGFIIPHADRFQGEYVASSEERLAWLTGFTGSAGTAVVLRHKAALFVDGRYTLQARAQAPAAVFGFHHLLNSPPDQWIAEHLDGGRLGYDPWLHTEAQRETLNNACRKAGGTLVAVAANPIDGLWDDRPPPPATPLVVHEDRYAGRSAAEKCRQIAQLLDRQDVDAALISAPDAVAWLLNIRANDVPFAPLPLCFAVIGRDRQVTLLVDPSRVSTALRHHLGESVTLRPEADLPVILDGFGAARHRVLVAADSAAVWIADRLAAAGALVVAGDDPCALPKACKGKVEIAGLRAAHRRDGVALARFLAWLEVEGPRGNLTEISAAQHLDQLRAEGDLFQGPSFPTISGAGANGAIIHYRVDADSNRPLVPGELYLVDSGGQYLDGTTDVTRTIAVGSASATMREHYTRVLKGHIALARARFPVGTTGSHLDSLARLSLWQAGLDYDHGTGHGVGHYLSVHEGPQRIARQPNKVPLAVGMVLSNEPGYYRPGAYGIRIENLMTVVDCPALTRPEGEDRAMLEFETLTLAPFDRTLLAPSLLNPDEIAWIDGYHARVREEISGLLSGAAADWLERATMPVMRED